MKRFYLLLSLLRQKILKIFHYLGPATIRASNGEEVLVGVASFIAYEKGREGMVCGPGVNIGKGYFEDDLGVYVDVYKYVDWIRKKSNLRQQRNEIGNQGK